MLPRFSATIVPFAVQGTKPRRESSPRTRKLRPVMGKENRQPAAPEAICAARMSPSPARLLRSSRLPALSAPLFCLTGSFHENSRCLPAPGPRFSARRSERAEAQERRRQLRRRALQLLARAAGRGDSRGLDHLRRESARGLVLADDPAPEPRRVERGDPLPCRCRAEQQPQPSLLHPWGERLGERALELPHRTLQQVDARRWHL